MNNFDSKAYWESVRQRFNEHVRPRLTADLVYGDLQKLERSSEGDWKACCPFHEDSSPSLSINAKTLQHHCFGCGEGGDVVKYISKKYDVKAKEAFAVLAEKAGLDRDVCLPSKAKNLLRDPSLEEKLESIRKASLDKELQHEKTRWKPIHDELSGLPHRVDMLHSAAARVSEMYALKVKELGRISDFADMVEGLVAEKTQSEMADGLAVRRFAFELPGGKIARFSYACELCDGEVKQIREKAVVEKIVPGRMTPEVMLSSEKVYDPKTGWTVAAEDKIISSKLEKTVDKETEKVGEGNKTDPLDAVRFYSEKVKSAASSALEMDDSITKVLAKEVSRAQELMLQLPDAELRRVAETIEKRLPVEHWNVVIKLPQNKELLIEHAIHLDNSGKIKAIAADMTLPNGKTESRVIEVTAPLQSEKERLLATLEKANRLFQANLFEDNQEARLARAYLERRGFSENEIKKSGFGLASGKEIFSLMRSGECEKDDLLRAGLLRVSNNNELKPVFFNRIMIPINSNTGNTIAFAARILDESATKSPKYINSPETQLFSKKVELFGLDAARDSIIKSKNVHVVEGYFDVLALQKAGVTNAVATMGTALTKEHVTLLKNLSPDVTLIFDSDDAGQKAFSRSKKMLDSELRVSVVEELSGKDPAAHLEKFGKQSLADAVEKNRKVVSVPIEGMLDSL